MSKIAYARISSSGQKLDVQLDKLNEVGCDMVFKETHTGTTDQRPQLQSMLQYAREGDILYITKLDRLGRSTLHLTKIFDQLKRKGVEIIVLDQNIDTSTPVGSLMLNVLASIAEFETEIRKERQLEGIAKAKAKGVRFGRKSVLDAEQVEQLKKKRKAGVLIRELMGEYGVSKATVYRLLAA
ncbi:resolvase [Candidatus Thioglobus autotrophicus]|jgi:DNA invertase Pin-like site-specific DNA recombinase|uniref:Resolvase n=1 Tax=Candidatus Thioglobus autotrophicus TaxID=1705394 RepID=A0A0M4NHB0_9GAMM|nr:recombinase family protein [Candidatus Thioglobus autotrophicus]ALE52620.1 resolvase [Candidatus Thioglobus autotrophicus]